MLPALMTAIGEIFMEKVMKTGLPLGLLLLLSTAQADWKPE